MVNFMLSAKMSEKLCLQWNDFKENVNSVFGKLREDKEFTDVTLVCEDGQLIEGHKVILATSSPFFENILQKSKHPHPLIYLKGFQSKDFASILDFLYLGEANVFQEDLDSFLAIAEEIKLSLFPLLQEFRILYLAHIPNTYKGFKWWLAIEPKFSFWGSRSL